MSNVEPVVGQNIAESKIVSRDSLQLWDRNPRSIKTDRFNELKERLKRQGQIKPLLVAADGKTVIGGNMRLRAMAELALELGLSPLELKSYALSLGAPTTLDLVVDKFGPEVEEDEVPEVDEVNEPESRLGEVYQLGSHRLMCGDSTDADAVSELMDGAKADMVFTDPPYNIAYEGGSKKREMIKNDIVADFYQFLYDAYTCMFMATKGGASFYVCHADSERINFTKAFIDAGGYLSAVIIWAKNNATFGRQDYFWKHEPILYGWNEQGSHKWYGDFKQDTIWNIDRPSSSEEHPTMKPLALITKAIKNSSKGDDIVLDLFGGSGSTLIACEQTNRTCYMMELDPKYCDVIRKRYAKHCGEDDWVVFTPSVTEVEHASR